MKLERVELHNFRTFDHLELPLGSRVTLLVGENGSGKSSILDAIAVGLGAISTQLPGVSGVSFKKSDLRQVDNIRRPYMHVKLTASNGLEWGRTEKRDGTSRTAKEIPAHLTVLADLKRYLTRTFLDVDPASNQTEFPVFVFYGVSRALLDVPLRRRGFPKEYARFQALDGALEADSRFRTAFMWFYNREQEELRKQKAARDFDIHLPELDAVRRAIEATFPGISNPRIETNPLRFMVDKEGEKLDIIQLSDGYKTMLALVIDLAYRMALANPQLKDPLHAEAVIMIDEVDLHLHPEWQQRVVTDLLRIFPYTQFILTTHSPYIIESLNNPLQLSRVKDKTTLNDSKRKLDALAASEVKAYVVGKGKASSMMDQDLGLLDNSLLDTFNTLANVFSELQEEYDEP